MITDKKLTYEESVQWIRDQPDLADLVTFCYLDKNTLAAAKRFAASEEFDAVTQILKINPSTNPLKILDLGCGNGIVSYAFASLGHHVHAVDPDESDDVGLGAVNRLAQSGVKGSITTTKSFAEALPFEKDTFDIVFTRQAVHHFADLKKGLSECSRVLKSPGRFLATREHVIGDEQQLQSFLENHVLHKLHGGENAFQLQQYLTAMEEAGLKVVSNLAHYDTIINHYPISNSDIENLTNEALTRKLGKAGAAIGMKLSAVKVFRARLSKACDVPGRFHTFLAIK